MQYITHYLQILTDYPQLAVSPENGLRIIQDEVIIQEFETTNNTQIGVLVEDRYVLVLRDLVQGPHGPPFGYLRILSPRALKGASGVIILPVVVDNHQATHLYLIRQFRHALRNWALECPRGFGTIGLDDLDNAKKELLEETNLTPDHIQQIGIINPDTGLMHNPASVYIAWIAPAASPTTPQPDKEIIQQIIKLPLSELAFTIASGKLTDGMTLSALAIAKSSGFLNW